MRLSLILVFAWLLASCATSTQVTSNYDRSVDFSTYRSFAFYQPLGTDQPGYESLVTQTLKTAVRAQMESRGYTYVESGADLLVNFSGRLAQRTNVSQTPASPAYYGYRRGAYAGWNGYETRVDQYVEGTLNVDLIDAQHRRLVWEGAAIGRVTSKTREDRQAAIHAAISEIFSRYPFKTGS